MLHGSLSAAHRMLKQPNPPAVWAGLKEALAVEMAAVQGGPAATGTSPRCPAGHGRRRSCPAGAARGNWPPDYLRIATTGLYNVARYPTPSHARQAVIASAVWAGMRAARRGEPAAQRGLARPGVLLHPVPLPRRPGARRS